MEKENKQNNWISGLLWITVNTLGWGLYILLARVFGWLVWEIHQSLFGTGVNWIRILFSDESNRILIAILMVGICWGLILGFLQKTVLKRRFDIKGMQWITATMLGMIIYLGFSGIVPSLFSTFIFSRDSILIIAGISKFVSLPALGIAQWFVLRQYFKKSEWWIMATVLASIFLMLIPSIITRGSNGNRLLILIILSVLDGFVYGLATLAALTIIVNRSGSGVEKLKISDLDSKA